MNENLQYSHFKNLIVTLVFLLVFGYSKAQNIDVKGKVFDEQNNPLPGASVIIEGTSTGTETDFDGIYKITATPNSTLVISFIGYKTQKIKVTKSTNNLNVSLKVEANVLEEIVVVGYGTQRKKEITGAVANVKAESITKLAVADLGTALQGKVAGVNIQAANGRPGQAANIQIRGLGSVNPGALGPLYVVDGVPFTDNPNIAPEQIESIDILKDGASASVYGVRASNGVILITTKKGKKGRMQIDLNAYTGIQNITSGTPLMNTTQQLFAEDTRLNAIGQEPLVFFFNPNALDFNSNFVEDIQNNNALVQSLGLNLNGGTKNLRVNFSSSYFDQEGVIIQSSFRRIANRLTADYTKGKFKAFASVGINQEDTEQEPFALYEFAVAQNPWQPSLSQITNVGQNTVSIPVRNAILFSNLSRNLTNIDEREVNSTNIAANFSYEITKGLDVKLNLGRNTWDFRRKWFRPQYIVRDFSGQINPTASRTNALLDRFLIFNKRETVEGIVNYKTDFGKHNLNFTGVISYEEQESQDIAAGVIFDETASNDIQVLSAGAEATRPREVIQRNTLAGKLLRLQYNFDGRYLFSASYRRDGSSRFALKNRFGNFYGFSAGWNIHEEKFFEKINFINSLKLRGSWAEVGNQNIPNYAFTPVIESGVNYPFGPNESLNFGFTQRRFVDENIRWETTISKNIGLDATFLDNRLSFTADYYENGREDMLLEQRLPPSAGTSQPGGGAGVFDVLVINAGDMINKGLEFAVSYKDETNFGLKYNFSSTFTSNRNTVTNLNGIQRGFANGRPIVSQGPNIDFTTFLAVGREAGAFFLVENAGVIKTQEQLDAYLPIDGSAQLGDLMFVDQNGDNVIDDNDRIYKGSGQADFEVGLDFNFEFKNFDLYVQNFYSQGAEIYNGAKLHAYGQGRHRDLFNMWSPQNPNSNIPTDRISAFHNNVRARSDFFLEDGTYWRIRNITLGYTIPGLESSGITKARLYISSVNPFTFTRYTGFDPEVGGDGIFTRGIDRGDYPVSRQFSLGVQLGF
ncbi:SusC/RagA family TonB-linked outer membrane protein [Tenacibaculum sp. M341]|uniref:SusC/RagA family TonB-linked outer membrane protein n=1 Tax=Tenacibaculum sp. M341 TaxID=2530339 RepID=UPI00104AE34D|nr:TonB-dependent receptor [Tenacibaculum sp. M341]TCI94158.1 TonB-dependent receptor [Tenacibaculum sp. M341]